MGGYSPGDGEGRSLMRGENMKAQGREGAHALRQEGGKQLERLEQSPPEGQSSRKERQSQDRAGPHH